MNKKKVLYILHNVQLGGAEVALISAIPDLNRRFDIKILALGTVSEKIIRHLSPDEQKLFFSIRFKPYTFPILIFRAVMFAFTFKPDIIISSFWRASLIGAIVKMLRRKTYYIAFLHSSGFAHKIDAMFSRLAIKTADKILADSSATLKFVNTKFSPKAPVEIVSFLTNSSPNEHAHLPIDDHHVRFLFLGRINRVKNLPQTVELIAYLRSKAINAQLDIYGKEDGEKEKLVEKIASLGLAKYITFKGEYYASDKRELFKKYHFLVQLSFREGMAMSVAEAMQNGLACVVTPVGEIANYAKDMETAVFMDTSSSDGWVSSLAKVEKVINDPNLYKKIGEGCYSKFRNMNTYSESLTEKLETSGWHDL